jgi:hypothetical protein
MVHRSIFAATGLCLSLVSFAAIGQTDGEGGGTDLSATAFAPFPFTEVIEVRAGRDLPLERDLAGEIQKILAARGFNVADKGQVIVTVDSTTPLPGIAARNAFTNEDRLRSMGTRRNNRGVTMKFDRQNAEPGAAIFTLRMSAYRPGQTNLWVGQASAPDNGSGRRSTTLLLAQTLAGALGRSEP